MIIRGSLVIVGTLLDGATLGFIILLISEEIFTHNTDSEDSSLRHSAFTSAPTSWQGAIYDELS